MALQHSDINATRLSRDHQGRPINNIVTVVFYVALMKRHVTRIANLH